MQSAAADATTEILLVVAGAAITLIIGGALLYWIDREWRELDAKQRRQRDATERTDGRDEPEDSAIGRPPED